MSTNSSPSKLTAEGEPPKSPLPRKESRRTRPPPESGVLREPTADEESATAEEDATAAEDDVSAPANEPHPPPRFTWARPLMQGYKGRINQYVRDEVVEHVELTLRAVGGEEAIERFREGPFGHFLDLRIGNSANNALHELMAHELEDATFSEQERWFHIGGTDIVFTAQDYTLVTGLAFTKKNYDPNSKKHEISKTSMFRRVSRGKRMKIDMLRHNFNARQFGDNVDDYLKTANIIFLYHLLICGGNVWIADWVWALVEDVERWSSFPWGAYSYQILCHNMSTLYKHPDFFSGSTYHFFGPIWALQIWSYEVIPALGHVCGTRDDEMRFPHCLMWKTHKSTTDLTSFFDQSLQVEPLEVTSTEESKNYYMMFVEWQRVEQDVLFVASKRNAWKKLPYAKQMEMFGKKKKIISHRADSGPSKRKHKDIEQPRPEAHHTSGHARKRRPSACTEAGPETEPSLKCCLHGLPCRSSEIDDDAHFARLAQRIAPHMPVDASETGWIAVFARRLVQMTSGRPSTSRACSSSRSISATRSHDHFHPMSSDHDVEQPTKDVVEHEHPSEHVVEKPSEHVVEKLSEYDQSAERDVEQPTKDAVEHSQPLVPSEHENPSDHAVEKPFEHEQPAEHAGEDIDGEDTDSEDGGDETLAPRQSKPSAVLRSPYVAPSSRTPAIIRKLYKDFRVSSSELAPPIISNGHRLSLEFFKSIEDCTSEFSEEVIDLYLVYKKGRLNNRTDIAIQDVYFYMTLLREFENYHGPNPQTKSICGKNLYKKWSCPQDLIDIAKKWKVNGQVVMICNVHKSHWVTVRVLLKEWVVELYDSKAFCLDEKELNARKLCVKPVTRLLPRLLFCTDYWKQNTSSPEKLYEMELRVMPQSETFCQVDSVSCGVFSCMYVDRILNTSSSRRKTVDEKFLADYRCHIARSIFGLTVDK